MLKSLKTINYQINTKCLFWYADRRYVFKIWSTATSRPFWMQQIFKGYLCYRTHFENILKMCHMRHRLGIFLFRRKVIIYSQDIQVFLFLIIPWFPNLWCYNDISTWGRVYSWIQLLNHNSLSHQTGHLIDINKRNNFQGPFE